jgi:spore coat protein A
MTTSFWRISAVTFFVSVGVSGLSSCSDEASSAQLSTNDTKVSVVGTVKAALSVDGCTDAKRADCASQSSSCLNGRCQGGAKPPQFDGCSQLERDNAAVFGCGCVNGVPSGGNCPVVADGCALNAQDTDDSLRVFFGKLGCGCKDKKGFGNFCATPPQDSPEMPIPSVLTPTTDPSGNDLYNIDVSRGTKQMRAGNPTDIVGYNGTFPGPTIFARKGHQVILTVSNKWDKPTSDDAHNVVVHNHGHKVHPKYDGHPIDYITPNNAKTYIYPNDQNTATYWYHDHTMDRTGPRVHNGLAGFYIIKDADEDRALNLPSGSYDVPIMLAEKKVNAQNVLAFGSTSPTIQIVTVNGVSGVHFNVDRHKYRFRLLNASADREFKLAFANRPITVIGTDGGLLHAPVSVQSLTIAPGERYDVVIDFRRTQDTVGATDILRDTNPPFFGTNSNLLEFRINRDSGGDASTVPTTLATVPRFSQQDIDAAVARSNPNALDPSVRTLIFSQDANQSWILSSNGAYDPNRWDILSQKGVPYVWTLDNTRTGFPHPFHKHLAQFQIIDINGVAIDPTGILGGWKDTIEVQPGQKVRVIFKNEGFASDSQCLSAHPPVAPDKCLPYVFHCHNLLHEDKRMMQQEIVYQ